MNLRASERSVQELRQALSQTHRRTVDNLDGGLRAARHILGEIKSEIARRREHLRRTEEELAACRALLEAHCSDQLRRRNAARVAMETAERVLRSATRRVDALNSQSIVLRANCDEITIGGQKFLRNLSEQIAGYATVGLPSTRGVAKEPATGSVVTSSMDSLESPPGLPEGIFLVPLFAIDTSDSAIRGRSDFRKGYTPEDLDWAFDAFEQVVLPSMAAGNGVSLLRDRDAASGLSGTRSYSMTFSQFTNLGDAIRLTRQHDGSFKVANGYHRLWIAQRTGRSYVPARIT